MADNRIVTKSESEKPNPDEGHLKAQLETEVRTHRGTLVEAEQHAKRKKNTIAPLVAASGLSEEQIDEQIKEAKSRSQLSLNKSQANIADPHIDIEALHQEDLKLVRSNAERMEPGGNPYWQGYIWNPSYCGWWSRWNGESEEVPSIACNTAANRIDPRTQAYGEGWFDGDFSRTHGYLAFRFNPPSWGHLHLRVYPWFHGYYHLYSNDEWYNSEYASARLHSWIDVYQYQWISRQYQTLFSLGGSELHPTRNGRVDTRYTQSYYTNVGANDRVTIRVGAYLNCYARAGGSHAILDFRSGTGNYIYVPYVYWYLHH